MRTTIEITPEHRARLVEIAARRGEKGFSHLIQEALDVYLKAQGKQDEQRRRALMLKGTLGAREGERLREATRSARESWR
jgi:hypothetical protein